MTKRTNYTALFAISMVFLAWWGGVDLLPAYCSFCVLLFSVWLFNAPWWED